MAGFSKYKTALLVLAGVLSSSVLFAQSVFYRYPSAAGDIVIDDRVPPEAIPRGYDVIRRDGSIVKTVPPRLTDEERRIWEQEQAVASARAEAAEKMRKWDESLLLRYSEVDDIDIAKQRALNDIRVRISILKSNLSVLKKQVEDNQRNAAELERQGREVPSELLANIADLRSELTATEQQIGRRSAEVDEVADNYERDKARFSELRQRRVHLEESAAN